MGSHPQHSSIGDWITHDAAGFFTLWLVIVGVGQAGLFVWQLRYMRKNLTDARLLAEAAKASAETAKEQVAVTKMGIIDLERAYLSVGPSKITIKFTLKPGAIIYTSADPQEMAVKLFVHNTGRTTANVKKLYGEFSNILPPGDGPVYSAVAPIVTDISIAAGEKDVLEPFEFTSDIIQQLFFWGYIEYVDIFKNTRTSRFCAVVFPPNKAGEIGNYQIAGSDDWRECD